MDANGSAAPLNCGRAVRLLSGMRGVVPYRMIFSCPQNGAFALYCISGGPGYLEEGRNRWLLPEEAVVLVRAGQAPVLLAPEHPLRMLNVVIGTNRLPAEEKGTAVFVPKQAGNEPPSALFTALLERLPAERESALLKEFFTKLRAGTQPLPMEMRPPDSVCLLKRILDTRYAEKLTLDLLAKELHWNKYKLEKDFKKSFGCSPFEYLLNTRVKEACRLLCETALSVVDVSLAAGMENPSYFIRMFKRRTGLSPLKYRALYASGTPPADSNSSARNQSWGA